MKSIESAQQYMREHGVDLWLLYDFRGSNDVVWQLLGKKGFTTRRFFLVIPCQGPPRALVHSIDRGGIADLLPLDTQPYRSRHELEGWLRNTVMSGMTVATEYSPKCAIPTLSITDAGTIEFLQSLGARTVSSADVFQRALAVWEAGAVESHYYAVREVVASLRSALDFTTRAVGDNGDVTEYDVQQVIMREFSNRGLETEEVPVVAVNENSGDPHYMPVAERTSAIHRGDWLLIDLWARRPGEENVFADITWVAFLGSSVPMRHREVFSVVAAARDAVITRLNEAWTMGEGLAGWELDDVARNVITSAGYGDHFIHRTGHSIGPGAHLHALGVNIDNFETQDLRSVLPGVGFSVEPGIYLPEFGVRSEIDVYVDPESGPRVTTPLQSSVETLLP